MSTIYIDERAADLIFRYGDFTDAEAGAILRNVYHFFNGGEPLHLDDRAMKLVSVEIINDMSLRNQHPHKINGKKK